MLIFIAMTVVILYLVYQNFLLSYKVGFYEVTLYLNSNLFENNLYKQIEKIMLKKNIFKDSLDK